MLLLKLGSFLGKLAHMELEEYFQKKRVVHSMFLQRTGRIAGIVKFIEVRITTMHLPDKLTEQNLVRPKGAGWSKEGPRPSTCELPRETFYLSPIKIGMHPNRFTIFGSSNNKGISVREIPLPLKNDMESVIKIYEPTMLKKSRFKPEQTLGVEVGIDMWGFVEPENGFIHSLFNFEESITEIFYQLINKPVAIQLPKAIMISITA